MSLNLLDSFVQIEISHPDDFLKIKETLERIGMAAGDSNTLYQSCHIFHKRGKLYIVHFKELFALDGKRADMTETDYARRNTICRLLEEWGLLRVVNPSQIEEPTVPVRALKIIPYHQRKHWDLQSKYSIGRR